MSTSVIRGMYIEKSRQAASILAEIVSATGMDAVMETIDPHREKLLDAHRALMEIQNQLRKQP